MSHETVPVATGLVPATEHVLDAGEREDDKLHEACGVVAVWSEDQRAPDVAYTTLQALQHRGRDGAGVSLIERVNGEMRAVIVRGLGRIAAAIDQAQFVPAQTALGHTRYGTSLAVLSAESTTEVDAKLAAVMPLPLRNKQGDQIGALAHNGQFNEADIQALAPRYGVSPHGTDTTVCRNLLEGRLEYHQGDMEASLKELLPQLSGSFCLTIMTADALYAVKDSRGIRPLWYGENTDGSRRIIASEAPALVAGGVTPKWEVDPGTYVVINEREVRTERWARADPHPCIFEHGYFAKPGSEVDSVHHHLGVTEFRRKMGIELAQNNQSLRDQLDIVVPVLGSGRDYAIGFALGLGLPYIEALKQAGESRSFTGASQADREAVVWDKLKPIARLLKDMRVAAVDDSIVRGTTSKIIVEMLRRAGASEVTLVAGMPRIKHPCHLGMAFHCYSELLAHGRSVDQMRHAIGADRLIFPTVEMVRKAGRHIGQIACMGCMTGKYPDMSAPLRVMPRTSSFAAS